MRTYKTGNAVVAALVAVALMVPSAQAAQLSNITVGRSQDFTVVTLFGDAPASVSHQAIEAKSGKPNRIVVDLTGVEHGLPKNNFDQLPSGSISRIRTSQFAVSPEPVVRIVLDLATAAAYKLETEGNNVRVMVSLPSDPPIAQVWSAANAPVLAQAVPSSPEEAPALVTPVSTNSAPTPSAATADATPEASSTKGAQEPWPATPAETVANPATPEVAATSPTDDNRAAAKLEAAPPASPDAPQVPVPMPKHKGSEVIDYNFPRPGTLAATGEPAQAEPTESTPAPKKAVTSNVAPTRNAPEPASPAPVVAKTSAPTPTAASSSLPPAESTPVASADKAAETPGTPVMPVAPDENDDYAVAEDGSAPIASLTTLPPMDVDAPSVVPARSKIVYHTNGRRDPFLPLLQVGAAYNAAALPDVSNLRLVGMLHDVDESWGLFEDANGFGYILRKGDRVRNGRLNKLTQTRAYFQLNEFGWSRSVELELEPEG